MRRSRWYPYLFLIICILGVCNTSKKTTQQARFFCIGALAPSWEMCQFFKEKVLIAFSSPSFSSIATEDFQKQLEKLKRENQVLQMQLNNVKEWLLHEDRIDEQMQRLQKLQEGPLQGERRFFYERRQAQLVEILKLQMRALPAKVVYREPCSWSSFLWINIGENQNISLKEKIVAKNSPVVIGNVLVGFVEEVGPFRSKVRLLTDSKLVPSVRAVRGSEQNSIVSNQIEELLQVLQTRQELFISEQEAGDLFFQLQKVGLRTEYFSEDFYLAKGELFGSSLPLWRSRGQTLQGVGFNYDFPDEEGPARDLRTGEVLSKNHEKGVPLLK
ncbi:MAG: hypothetical protein JSS09_05780, partial [Verrucomicrobia bacterium]|nr:hypothetical protein [Verrucomicrobiota bacterium]